MRSPEFLPFQASQDGRRWTGRRKVELFEQIRREYRFEVETIRGVTKQFGVHRPIVRQALAIAITYTLLSAVSLRC